MSKQFKIDQDVRHNFSKEVGSIIVIRTDPDGYDYCVQWWNGEKDWYKADVLEAV